MFHNINGGFGKVQGEMHAVTFFSLYTCTIGIVFLDPFGAYSDDYFGLHLHLHLPYNQCPLLLPNPNPGSTPEFFNIENKNENLYLKPNLVCTGCQG